MGALRPTRLLSVWLCAQNVVAVSLSQFQAIESFPPICMAAWESQIPGCTARDFSDGRSCSAACIQGLEALTVTLNDACARTRAGKDTLIGLFFQNLGVSTLCPNAASNSSQTTTASQIQSTSAAGTVAPTTVTPTSTSMTETSASTTTSSQSSTTSTSTSSSNSLTSVDPTLQITFDGTATTTQEVTSSTSSPLGSSETQGFGGSGNAFNILAGAPPPSGGKGLQRAVVSVVIVVFWIGRSTW